MSTVDEGGDATLAPDEAFSVLGNETRMEILRILAATDDTLAFSELYDRASMTDSGNFTYHLDRLVGHFVEDTDEGYDLRRAGERIVEAVVSGAVTETPVVESTQVEWPCQQCGTDIVVSYREGRVTSSCPECSGIYGDSVSTEDPVPTDQLDGYLGGASLPPAAVERRDAKETLQAGHAWTFLEKIALSHDICPRCSTAVERTLTACEDHDASAGLCETCDRRHQESVSVGCPNCPLSAEMPLPAAVHGYPRHLNFVTAHGFDPVVPTAEQWAAMGDACEWVVIATDPLKARITYSMEGHVLTLTVDENLDVVDVTETGRPDPDEVKHDPTRL